MSLWQMSASAAVMITAVLVLRRAAIGRLPKRTFTILWDVTLLRLLTPVAVVSPFSVYALIARLHAPGASAAAQAGPPAVHGAPAAGLFPAVLPQAAGPSLWAGTWAAGAALCALYFAVAYIRCRRRFATARPVKNKFAAAFLAEKKAKRQIALRQSERIAAPLSYGIFHPVILMPAGTDWSDTESLRFVLQHEYVHIRRLDGAVKILLTAALCLHWCNPFVWAMYVLANRDIELACDEAVVRSFGEKTKAAYALALIGMEEQKSGSMPFVSGFSKNAIEERIGAIMKMQKATTVSLLIAGCMVVGTAAAFATSAPAQAAPQAVTDLTAAGGGASVPQALTQKEILSAYGAYGVSFDANGKMLFDGETVRFFWDGAELGDGGQATRYEYLERTGTVDAHTIRSVIDNGDGSVDPFGALLGVKRYTQQEFDQREVNGFSASPGQATEAVSSGTDQTGGRTLAEIFARYEAYGIRYEAAGNVYWNEQPVSVFVDESPDGGIFTHQSADGDIVVRAVYDKKGNLSGVKPSAA